MLNVTGIAMDITLYFFAVSAVDFDDYDSFIARDMA